MIFLTHLFKARFNYFVRYTTALLTFFLFFALIRYLFFETGFLFVSLILICFGILFFLINTLFVSSVGIAILFGASALINNLNDQPILDWYFLDKLAVTVVFLGLLSHLKIHAQSLVKKENHSAKTIFEIKPLETSSKNGQQRKLKYLSNMSHEIRTPLNGIIGMAELLSKTNLSNIQQRYLNSIKVSSIHLMSIVGNILDINKIEAGRLHIEQRPFLLQKSIKDIFHAFETRVNKDKILLKQKLNIKDGLLFIGDEHRIVQVISNLLSNATKFTTEGHIFLYARSKPTLKMDNHKIDFIIFDSGIGISPKKLKHIFIDFKQVNSSIRSKQDGHGLGLPISQMLVEKMGGKLSIKSRVGKGSCLFFSIYLDALKIETIRNPQGVKTNRNSKKRSKQKILIVDDDLINQSVSEEILKQAGYEVELANDGSEAIQLAKFKKYSLILMDCQMPGISGHDATLALRSSGITIPIIALTADGLKENQERCLKAGMNTCLFKPVSSESLLATVDLALAKESTRKTIADSQMGSNLILDESCLLKLKKVDPEKKNRLINRLIDMYLKDIESNRSILQKSVKKADKDSLEKIIHKFSSSNKILGLSRVVGTLDALSKVDSIELEGPALLADVEHEINKGIDALIDAQKKL